jgi:outer membrane lipoprotein SlyB
MLPASPITPITHFMHWRTTMFGNAQRFVVTVATAMAAFALPLTVAAQGNGCKECGVVQSVQLVEQKGQGSGVGMIAGGVIGGVLGHQIGSGRGNTVATIAGAGAGAYAGNEIEKNKNTKRYWSVAIRMDNGQNRSFTYSNEPAVHQGERVRLVDGGRRLALVSN